MVCFISWVRLVKGGLAVITMPHLHLICIELELRQGMVKKIMDFFHNL